MSNNNENQKNNVITKKRKTNSVINKGYNYKNDQDGSRCITCEKAEDKVNKPKTFQRRMFYSKSCSNFNKCIINFDNAENKEYDFDFFRQKKISFVPKIFRHKRKIDKYINIDKEDVDKNLRKEKIKHQKIINKTYNNFNDTYKRAKRTSSTLNNNINNKYLNENFNESDLIQNRIRHSAMITNTIKKSKKEKIPNLTDINEPFYFCKTCFDKKMLEEKMSSFSKTMANDKDNLIEKFINENPFYFIDKMNNIEKRRIQTKLDNLSNKQRRVLPIYQEEINKPDNLKIEQLQLINEFSINPLAIDHRKDPKFVQQKIIFDKKENIIYSNPKIYKGLGPRKAYQDYYEKCMYQVPHLEENYKINQVYKKNYIKTLEKQIDDKVRKEKQLKKKIKTSEYLANKQFNEYKKSETINDLIKSSHKLQMLNRDNKKLEEYKKYKKEKFKREEEKFGYKLDLMKDKENMEYKIKFKKERDMEIESYNNMFEEMNRKREMKIYNKNEEKRKWNDYLDKYNMRFGYLNRYNNCDGCNRPIQDKNKQLKKYPPSKENVVNIN